MGHFCKKCGLVMNDDQFYTSKNKEKYPPDGKLDMCKKCMTMHVDNWDPSTYLWILEEIDIPYVKDEWNKVLAKSLETSRVVTGTSVVGKYISRMKIKQWSSYTWADSDRLNEEQKQKKIRSMKAQGFTQDEIETEVNKDKTPAKPKTLVNNSAQNQEEDVLEEQGIDFDSQLTQEDKMRLRLKWGKGYTAEQWIKLEQLYTDFENSYDIQTAGHKDTLIMVCKASLKANQLFDMDDIENAQRMTRVYNDLMKSGNFDQEYEKLYWFTARVHLSY